MVAIASRVAGVRVCRSIRTKDDYMQCSRKQALWKTCPYLSDLDTSSKTLADSPGVSRMRCSWARMSSWRRLS